MKTGLSEQAWFNTPTMHPFWMGLISFLVALFGLFFLGWKLVTVIWLLWFEVIFAVGASLIRVFFALQGQGFFANLLFRLFITGAAAVLGIAFIMLTVTFTINGIDTENLSSSDMVGFYPQMVVLFLNYLAGLILHYFVNGHYKTARPIEELMATFVYLLILLSLIMPITMHLLPRYPAWKDAKWVALTVVVVKFIIDVIYSRVSKPAAQLSNPG